MSDSDSLPSIQRAQAGDEHAVDELLAQHLPGLHGYLAERAGDLLQAREPVSDLVQSTCREVLQDLDGHAFENEVHFRRWLYQAALRKVVDKARFHKAERRNVAKERIAFGVAKDQDESMPAPEAAFPEAEQSTPSEVVMRQEDMERVEAALARLSKEHRDVIVMARFMHLPHAEIARHFGKSEEATRALLSRALKSLRALMD